jgi:excisionase family DNA binding protein
MAEEQQGKRTRTSRSQRVARMDKEILDVEGAADVLGVSKTTIYKLAREGTIPATRVGREWRFSRTNLVKWIGNGTEADQLAKALRNGKITRRRSS